MKLTTKNVKSVLKSMEMKPCKEGMKALEKLLKQKRSMEFVFNKMSIMRRDDYEVSYADWLCNQMRVRVWQKTGAMPSTHLYPTTFKNFKTLFEML